MTAAGAARPQDLPRLLMRRAGVVAAAVLLLAVLLGAWRVRADIDEEVGAGLQLAAVMATLGGGSPLDDAALLRALKAQLAQGRLRHVALELRDAHGRLLLTQGPVAGTGLASLLPAPAGAEARVVAWALARPEGGPWTVQLRASREGERSEALANLGGMLALLLLCVAGLLVSMRWNLRHALQPLAQLLSAMAGIGRGDLRPLRVLPAMPVTELQAVAQALRQLAQALDEAQAQRRELSIRMLTLQEAERQRIAHELHDELGQRLTAMRVQSAHLLRALAPADPVRPGVQQLQQHCEQVQHEVRQLLAGLQPFDEPGGSGGPVSLQRLGQHLVALVERWNMDASGTLQVHLELQARAADGQARAWPHTADATTLALPPALAQVLYRISQESLTNVARHAGADEARLRLTLHQGDAGQPWRIDWQVRDDGRGLADLAQALRRGNGLAGIHQRVWAAGGELRVEAAGGPPERPGLQLSASLAWPADLDAPGAAQG